jgi:hypothetical protein
VAEQIPKHNSDLFADQLIASYVDDPAYAPRRWLAEEVERAATDEQCQLVLLEAEPGAGKTAALASLARAHPNWLRFFLRRDSRLPWQSGDIRSFLFTVGHQLAAQQPRLFRSRQLQITVEQIVGRVQPGGRASGIRVGDLTVSPFHPTAVNVEQHVSVLEGSLEGLSVDRLTVEERLLEVANLQYLALLAPAEALLMTEPHERVVVLVDALDEITQSSAADGSNIVTWLATCPELPANLRFIVASRPNPEILQSLRGRYRDQLRLLRIDPRSEQVRMDLTRSAYRFVDQQRIAAALSRRGLTPQGFVHRVVEKADGNFQYLAALFAALDHAVQRGEDQSTSAYLRLEELPTSLSELYAFLLDRIRWAVRGLTVDRPGAGPYDAPVPQSAWQGLYQPILGVLTVAERPLTEQHVARFINSSASNRWFLQAVEALTPLLRRGADGIALYHASFAEFLSAEGTRVAHPQLFVDPDEWHRSIVRSYRGRADRWDEVAWADVDDYGLLTLGRHLRALAGGNATSVYAGELDRMLCAPLMHEKRRRFGSHRPFAVDVRMSVSLAAVGALTEGAVLEREVRGRYLLALLDTLTSAVPLRLIMVLVRLGDIDRALALADLKSDRVDRARVYLTVGTALAGIAAPTAPVLIEQALDMLNTTSSDRETTSAADLGSRLTAAAAAGGPASDELKAAAEALSRQPGKRKDSEPPQPSLAEQARIFIGRLPPSTAEVSRAREVAARTTVRPDELVAAAYLAVRALVDADPSSPARLDELSALAGLLARSNDPQRLADALELTMLLEDDGYGTLASTWAAFANACAILGQREGLDRILEAAEDESDNTFRVAVLRGLAHAWGMVGDQSGIAEVVRAASQLDPAFASPTSVLAEVPSGALDGGHQDLARDFTLGLLAQLERVPDDPEMRVRLLHDIAAALVDVDQTATAAAICHEAVPLTAGFVEMSGASQGLSFSGMGDRALALADLAEELGRCGDADGVWSVGLQALEAASASLSRRAMCQKVGSQIARALVAADSSHQVRDAIQLTGEASGPKWVAQIVTAYIGLSVAPLLHAHGERQEASAHIENASRVAAMLHGEEAEELRGKIAVALDETDQPGKALDVIDTIQDPFIRASCLRWLAERRANRGHLDDGARLAHRSLDGMNAMNRLIDRIDTQAGAAHTLARCGDVRARFLANTALESLTTLDSQWHARPLGHIIATAVLTSDQVTADRALALARYDLDEAKDPGPLAEAAQQVAGTGHPARLEQIVGLVDVSADPELAQDLCGPLITAYLHAGDVQQSLRIWRTLLGADQLGQMRTLTRTLNRGVHTLAALDRGHTLTALHRAMSEARSWWSDPPQRRRRGLPGVLLLPLVGQVRFPAWSSQDHREEVVRGKSATEWLRPTFRSSSHRSASCGARKCDLGGVLWAVRRRRNTRG